MKPASNEVRNAFIEEMQSWHKSRLEIGQRNKTLTGRDLEIYNLAFQNGFEDAIGVAIAATDSRELNGAKFRIVDLKGDYIPFYDNDRPKDGGTVDDFDKHIGLIKSIFPQR